MVTIHHPVAPSIDRDHHISKPPIFDGDKFDYWKDRIKSLFLGHGVDLWDMVVDGYTHPIDGSGNKVERRMMTD